MSFSSPVQIKQLASTTLVHNQRTPFTQGSHLIAVSASGDTIYGANKPGELNTAKFARLRPGVVSAGTGVTVPLALNDMHDASSVTAANRLRLIAIKNQRLDGGTILLRVGNATSQSTGEFRQTDANTLKFGDNLIASDEIDLYVLDAADITTITGGALTAGREYSIDCYHFMNGAGTNTTDLIPLAHA